FLPHQKKSHTNTKNLILVATTLSSKNPTILFDLIFLVASHDQRHCHHLRPYLPRCRNYATCPAPQPIQLILLGSSTDSTIVSFFVNSS
ncbi:hypothetical protein LINPERPRIM_LOCUS30904, partial [Linum perenne]